MPKKATPSKLSKETVEDLDIVASPGRVVEPKFDSNGSVPIGKSNKSSINNNTKDRLVCATKDKLGTDSSNRNASPHSCSSTRERDNGMNGHGHRSYSGSVRYKIIIVKGPLLCL